MFALTGFLSSFLAIINTVCNFSIFITYRFYNTWSALQTYLLKLQTEEHLKCLRTLFKQCNRLVWSLLSTVERLKVTVCFWHNRAARHFIVLHYTVERHQPEVNSSVALNTAKLSTWEWLCKYRDYCSQSWALWCLPVEVHSLRSAEQHHLVIQGQHCFSPEHKVLHGEFLIMLLYCVLV